MTIWPRSAIAIGASLLSVGALVALPGSTSPAQSPDVTTSSLPDGGVVRLHLGPSDYFRFDAPDGSGGYTPGTPAPISVAQCAATTSGVMAVQVGPANGRLGLVADGLGVRVGGEGQGQPCGQVNGTGQSLGLTLTGPLTGMFMDRAELDIEGKFDATVRADLYRGSELAGVETLDTGLLSDSGPDAGTDDNYRWVIPGPGAAPLLFDRLVLRVDPSTPNGGFSLAGGAEGTAPAPGGLGETLGTSDSLFHLVGADGVLDCGDQASTGGSGDPSATVERLDNLEGDPDDCVPVAYALDSGLEGEEQFVFLGKDLTGQVDLGPQFRMTIVWLPEAAMYPVARTTQIDTGSGAEPESAVWCGGTPAAPELPEDKLWCLSSQAAVPAGTELIQVTEGFYGVNDPRVIR
jgi:hypothetical protein